MGYKFQFITLAGFHALNHSMFDLARGYADEGMPAYVRLQDAEFAAEAAGYTATRHQREVGTGYFDLVTSAITPDAATTALAGLDRERAVRRGALACPGGTTPRTPRVPSARAEPPGGPAVRLAWPPVRSGPARAARWRCSPRRPAAGR